MRPASPRPVPRVGTQVVLRTTTDAVLAPSPAARRELARLVAKCGRDLGLVAFGIADTHLHAVVVGGVERATEFARRARIAWFNTHPAGAPLERASAWPVRDQWHLASVGLYVLRQAARHGVGSDRCLDGSMVLDVAGLRVAAEVPVEFAREHLPRLSVEALVEILGVPELEDFVRRPLAAAAAGSPVLGSLAEAAAAALGIAAIRGRSEGALAARCAAVHAVASTVPPTQLASALGCSVRVVRRALSGRPDPRAVAAVRGQLLFRAALAARECEPVRPAPSPREAWEDAEARAFAKEQELERRRR